MTAIRSWLTLIRVVLGPALVLAIFLLVAYFAFGSTAAGLEYLRGERLILTPAILNAGCGVDGATGVFHCTIHNYTGADVKIVGSQVSCGTCLAPPDLPLVAHRGRSLTIPLQVRYTSAPRDIDERITFFTDCQSRPQLKVRVQGSAIPNSTAP